MIDHLELVRLLGRGMVGEVFEAVDRESGGRFVVKRMRPQVVSDTDMARFQREAALMERLRHPNLMPVVFVDARAPQPYYVMPFREGETLADRVRRGGRLQVSLVARIARDVCAGLVEAHALGIVHRDVKPANIFLELDGRSVILDFGLAKALASADALTANGTILGTPAYMAPEQCRGEAVDGAADVYSLGVTLVELLLGKNPFSDKDVVETIRRQLEAKPRRLDVVVPQRVSAELGELVDSMLSKDPTDRPSAAACHEAFTKIIRTLERRTQTPTVAVCRTTA